MSGSGFSFAAFLPKNAFLMAKRGRVDSGAHSEVSEASPCHFCGAKNHRVFRLGRPQAEVVFLMESGSSSIWESEEGRLLLKILEPMHLRQDAVEVFSVQEDLPENREVCASFQLRELKGMNPKVVIILGEATAKSVLGGQGGLSELRGRIHQKSGLSILPSEGLGELLQDPVRKKQAWEDLKVALRVLRPEKKV